MKKIFFFTISLCWVITLSAQQFDDMKMIQSGGIEREYLLYVPATLKPNCPLFISCHGMNQNCFYQREQMSWLPLLADSAGFVVVFPMGIAGNVWGVEYDTGWNINDMTDINFMLDIVNEVKAEYHIDDTSVYMSGFSLGGIFTYYVAKKAADKFAAFVPFSGYELLNDAATGSRPVPIFHLHGTEDDVVPYAGVENYLTKWYNASHCDNTPVVQYDFPSPNSGTTLTTYTACDCDVEVKLLTVPELWHDWTVFFSYPDDCAAVVKAIWDFCRQYNTSCGTIPQAIDNTTVNTPAVKHIEDGQLLIERGDKHFNILGAEVR